MDALHNVQLVLELIVIVQVVLTQQIYFTMGNVFLVVRQVHIGLLINVLIANQAVKHVRGVDAKNAYQDIIFMEVNAIQSAIL